jgi:3-isopropylmalate dehydrogenase
MQMPNAVCLVPYANKDEHMTTHLLLLPGDGIGQEVMQACITVLDFFKKQYGLDITTETDAVGGTAYDQYGTPLADSTLAKAKAADAVLFGAVGGYKWDNLPFTDRPEQGLLRLRKELGLFANLRPALVFPALVDASSLKPDLVRGLDILIVRELTGGVYFGEPRGITTLSDGQERGVNTQVYTTSEIERVARVAFDLAAKRGGKLCSVEKSNVMESGALWRKVVSGLAVDYPAVTLSHMYADNCAMQLVRAPKQFDVIVTDNLFGDLLSDCAAMLTGSLGMLPSASLGAVDAKTGKRPALYEPVHGSAPDIAGQDKANPCAMLSSLAMCLRYSMDRADLADMLEKSVANTLEQGIRTGDIMADGCKLVGTKGMTEMIIKNLA